MPTASNEPKPSRRRVLVIDDDDDIRQSVADALHAEGFEVTALAGGTEALDWLLRSKVPPDLIILDLVMPCKSGLEVLGVLRQSVTWVAVPVIVLSAFVGSPPAGAVAWLRKPVRPEELVRQVVEQIDRHA